MQPTADVGPDYRLYTRPRRVKSCMEPNERLPPSESNAEKPLRSILKSSSASGSRTSPQFRFLPSASTSTGRVQFSEPARTLHDFDQIPQQGPIPGLYLPPTQNREQLEALAFQLAAQLRFQRIQEEERRRREEEEAAAKRLPRPTHKPDDFPEFRQMLMGRWMPCPDCKRYHSFYIFG
jgi:hypothetical protein